MKKQIKETEEMSNGLYLTYAIVFVAILILLTIAATYSYFRINVTRSNTLSTITAAVDCINITYNESAAINLDYQYPISDTYAVSNVNPLTVTITNSCTSNISPVNYTLALTTLKVSPVGSNPDTYIPNTKIRMQVLKKIGNNAEAEFISPDYVSNLTSLSSGNAYSYLTSYFAAATYNAYDTKNYYRIDSNTIANSTTITYKIKFWIDYYEGDSNMYTGVNPVHNESYDNTTEDKYFKGAVSLVINPDTYVAS